jgi:hypothetical protein
LGGLVFHGLRGGAASPVATAVGPVGAGGRGGRRFEAIWYDCCCSVFSMRWRSTVFYVWMQIWFWMTLAFLVVTCYGFGSLLAKCDRESGKRRFAFAALAVSVVIGLLSMAIRWGVVFMSIGR